MKLRCVLIALVVAAAMLMPVSSSATAKVHCRQGDDGLFRDNDVDVDFDEGSIIFTHEDDDESVEITDSYELIVNGRTVHLDPEERKLVTDYYHTYEGIMEEAAAIGIEGAKLGVRGAAIGIAAVLHSLKSVLCESDIDEIEHKLDHEGDKLDAVAAKIEKKAARLEKKAEKLERKAKTLDRLHGRLRNEVRELDDLGWF